MCMVMAGKATVLRKNWPAPQAAAGIALLQAGAATRTLLARVRGRRHTTWDEVWRRRRDWRPGYPLARQTIFGFDPSTGSEAPEKAPA